MTMNGAPFRLALVMFGLLPFLASLKGLMIPANITLLVPVAAFAAFVIGRWPRVGSLTAADFGLIGLFVFMSVRVLASADVVLQQPLDYGLHVISLLYVCPFMFYVGRVTGTGLETNGMAKLLILNLVIVVCFLAITVIAPDFVRRNGLEANSYYQYMGDGLAVAALAAWACNYRPRLYWPYLLTAVLLVSVGSRASAVAFLIAMAFSNARFLIVAGATGLPLGFWLLGEIERGAGLDWAGQFRVLSTFLDFYLKDAEDASYSERQQYFDNAIDVIDKNPLMGEVAYEMRTGGMGEFVHNILHLWANFGLIALCLMVLMIFGGPISRLFSSTNVDERRPFPLLVFVAVELLFFRHPENVVLFFALGLLTSLYDVRNADNSLPYTRSRIPAQ